MKTEKIKFYAKLFILYLGSSATAFLSGSFVLEYYKFISRPALFPIYFNEMLFILAMPIAIIFLFCSSILAFSEAEDIRTEKCGCNKCD